LFSELRKKMEEGTVCDGIIVGNFRRILTRCPPFVSPLEKFKFCGRKCGNRVLYRGFEIEDKVSVFNEEVEESAE
jgi:hypothetical protein